MWLTEQLINIKQVNLQNLGTLGVEQFPSRTKNNSFRISIFLRSNAKYVFSKMIGIGLYITERQEIQNNAFHNA